MSRPAHILLIEDNRMDIELTLDAFRNRHLGNSIAVATDGEDGLDYVFGRGKYGDRRANPVPDLILLDLKMPKMDGFEVLRQLKAAPGVKRIPVTILTSSKE